MNILHISFGLPATNEEVSLRFHRGAGALSRSYLVEGNDENLDLIPKALSYIFTARPLGALTHAELSASDSAGQVWRLKRVGSELVCLRNDARESHATASAFLNELWRETSGESDAQAKAFGISQFYILALHDRLHAKPFADPSKSDDMHVKFLGAHIRAMKDACRQNLGLVEGFDAGKIIALCTSLEPLYREYKNLLAQHRRLHKNQTTSPRPFEREHAALAEQLQLLKQIGELCHALVQSQPSIAHLRQELRNLDEAITKNLGFCKLTELPVATSAPDWTIPLQCLCYINVLEKLAPVLDESIAQFNSHFQRAANTQTQGSSIDRLIEGLGRHLEEALGHLEDLDGRQKTAPAASALAAFTWYDRLKQRLQPPSEAREPLASKLSGLALREALSDTLGDIRQLVKAPSQLGVSAGPLEEFREATQTKLANLRRHWQKLAEELSIPAPQSMHEFLQYILRYSELFILDQKRREVSEALAEKVTKLQNLKGLVELWYEKTHSQKVAALTNPQIILSEAQNIVRYRAEKEQKFAQLGKAQLAIAVNNHLQKQLEQRAKALAALWNEAFAAYAPQPIPPRDGRLPMLFEKVQILKTLINLQEQTIGNQTFELFAAQGHYSPLCTWSFLAEKLTEAERGQFIAKLAELPAGALHIFLCRDDDLARSSFQAGVGRIVVARRPREHEPLAPVPRLPQANGRPSLSTSASSRTPIQARPRPVQAMQSAQASKAQAVVDLLNGAGRSRPLGR